MTLHHHERSHRMYKRIYAVLAFPAQQVAHGLSGLAAFLVFTVAAGLSTLPLQAAVLAGRSNFYNTDYLTLAYLKNALSESDAKHATRFYTMPPGSKLQLPCKQCWFQLNHHDPSNPRPSRSFAAVLIVGILPGATHGNTVYLSRNAGWSRQVNGATISLPALSQDVAVSPETFSTAHRTSHSLADLDRALGVKWHGSLAGTPANSVDRQEFWDITTAMLSSGTTNSLSAYLSVPHSFRPYCSLISFTPTPRKNAEHPLLIHFNPTGCAAALMRVFVEGHPPQDYYFELPKAPK